MENVQADYLMYLDAEAIEQAEPERFQITDDSRADWALRKLAQIEARKAERTRFIAAERARLDTWQAGKDAKDERFSEFLTSLLRGYYDSLKHAGILGNTKTYSLPHGRLSARQAEVTWRRDDAKLLEWAEPLGLVRIEKKPAWDLIKAMLEPASDQAFAEGRDKITGKVIPGVTVERHAGEVFSVKPTME